MENNDFDEILKFALSEKPEPPAMLNKKIVEMANIDNNIQSVAEISKKSIFFIILVSVLFTVVTGAVVCIYIASLALKLSILLMFTISVAGEIILLAFANKQFKHNVNEGVLQ